MKKKILSLMLALAVCCALLPALSVSVSAAMVNRTPEATTYTQTPGTTTALEARLAELIAKYDGTYWTSTGQPCSAHRENCYSKYFNAWQCNGFARYIFAELFCTGDIGSYDGSNPYYIPTPRSAVEVNRTDSVALGDTAAIQAFLAPAQPGDFLQIFDRETGRPHSMIVVSTDKLGLHVLDCNSDGHCGVKYHQMTWTAMAARYEKLSLYHSTVYPTSAALFTDVADSDWFASPVKWAVENGITKGSSPTAFSPYAPCTRAQVVTFLYAAAGKPQIAATRSPFADVKPSDWYFAPVMWAVENGITGGLSPTLFGPNATCTRAQIVTFLYAALHKPPVSGSSSFVDVANTDWYAAPVIWAVENGITSGIGNGMFAPLSPCTRGEVVTFLYKLYHETDQIP